MQLVTDRFGGIAFDALDIIVFEDGLGPHNQDRQWLLLADSCDENLYWLQSISNSQVAIPVLSLDGMPFDYELSTTSLELDLGTDNLVVLLPVEDGETGLTVDLHLPIVVDSRLGRGLQLRNERHQPLQRLSSELPTLLRQSA